MTPSKRPKPPVVPLELWRELFHAAVCFQSLAPWQWMHDRHVLGIDDEHGVRLVSVIGNLREVFGMAIYRGSSGVNFLLRMLRGDTEPDHPDALYQNDSILLDFIPRTKLRKEDLPLIKAIEFKPADAKLKLYPEFESHKPGYLPWFIDEKELRCALETLRKILSYAALIRDHPDEIDQHRTDEFPFFPAAFQEPLTWKQFVWHIVTPVADPLDPVVPVPTSDLAAFLKAPQPTKTAWEASAFYTPMSIQQPPRPYWPKIGLAVDAPSGLVLDVNVGTPDVTMPETAAKSILNSIAKHGVRPAKLYVDSFNMAQALAPLAAALKIKLVEARSLPMLKLARESLEDFSAGQS